MMSMQPKTAFRCSLVIPTKNGGALFKTAIEALQRQTCWLQTELIVIDSGSSDGTVDVARAVGARVMEIPSESFNHGLTRDLGISMASSGLVVLMVQDAVAGSAELLDALLKPFDDLAVAGVYARQIPQVNADLLTQRNLNGWLTGRDDREVREMKSLEWYQMLSPIEKYLFCNFDNVCSAIRKSVWQEHKFGEVGFGEDIDWAERVLKMGYKIVYEPAASVIHSHDRPLSYEYKRIYVCHRKLYRQFGLHLVPGWRTIFRSWLWGTVKDTKYILAQGAPLLPKAALLIKVPFLNFLSAIAQYRAARDEEIGNQRVITGI